MKFMSVNGAVAVDVDKRCLSGNRNVVRQW